MNDQSNPVGTDQSEIAAKENGRRRLVRGVVSLAPVVLTLRSGGLAAASAGAAVVAYGTVNDKGEITVTQGNVKDGDICVYPFTRSATNDFRISGGTLDSKDIKDLKCGHIKADNNSTVQVAILSSNSVSSL